MFYQLFIANICTRFALRYMKETPSKVGYLRKIVEMFSAGYFLSDQQI